MTELPFEGRAGRPRRGIAAWGLAATIACVAAAATAAPATTPTAGKPAAGAAEPAQKTFPTPEAASDAFVKALTTNDPGTFRELFGPEVEELRSTDKVTSREETETLAAAAKEALTLRKDGDDTVTLVIGKQAWPFPVPLVRENGAWRYDTAAGLDELVSRRIGAHELAAIELCRAYVEAQLEYASVDRDGDEVRAYAQKFGSTPGARDGLFWPDEPGGEQSPLGPFVAAAGDYAKGRQPGDPFKGYYFRILTKQGPKVPGGAYDYVINGRMIAGFALVAFPADYGRSGIMTFVVNQQGKVFQKDLGPKTAEIAGAMTRYEPDATWTEVTDG